MEKTLPLFDDDPFVRSTLAPSPVEVAIARVIWRHAGWKDPVSIADLIAACGPGELDARRVKKVVEQLRAAHRVPIGSRRELPAGYFRIVDDEDLERAIRPYRAQIFSMLRVVRACVPRSRAAEFFGQLRLVWEE